MILKKQELEIIKGGAWSASMVTAILSGFEALFALGQSIGKNLATWFCRH